MKRDYTTLSDVRESSPFATPPRVLVMAEEGKDAWEAVALAEALDAAGADTEVRFGAEAGHYFSHAHPDAVIVAEGHGYRIARNHPVLETLSRGK